MYVAIPGVWMELEPSTIFYIPSPCVLYYFSNRILSGTAPCVQAVWRVTRSEQAVAVLMSYLDFSRDGVSKRSSTVPRIHHSRLDVMVPIAPDIRQFIQEYGFFHIFGGTLFEAALVWVAYSQTLDM